MGRKPREHAVALTGTVIGREKKAIVVPYEGDSLNPLARIINLGFKKKTITHSPIPQLP